MIFKTFNSDIDNISSKWGLFGKSFYDVSTDIEKRWNNVSKTLQSTNDYTLQNIANAWKMGDSNPIKLLADDEVVSILDRYNKALDSGAEATAKFLNSGTGNEFMDGFLKDLDGAPATMDKYKVATKNATVVQKSFSASTIATKAAVLALNVAVSMGLSIALSALIKTISEVAQSEENLKDSARELGSELSNTVSSIEDYKKKIEELKIVLSNSSSSFDDVSQARIDLMAIQDELIDKFGTEKGVIEDITEAIYGQTNALNELSKESYYKAKNKFNEKTNGDKFIGGLSQWLSFGEVDEDKTLSNMDKMVNQMLSGVYQLKTTGNEVLDELIAKSYGLNIYNDTYGDGKHFFITGELDEIQEKIRGIQELTSGLDISTSFENSISEISNSVDSYLEANQNLYDQYILWEKILTNSQDNQYDEQFNLVNQAKETYDEALKSNDPNAIEKASENYAQTLSSAIALALNNGDKDVAGYFENMYPELQQMFSEWKFTLDFEPNTDGLKDKVSNSLIGLEGFSSEDIMAFNPNVATEEQINAYGELNNVASEYGLTLKGLINLLMQMGLIQSESYQQLVNKFGQDAVDKLTPEDLEIAYTISSEEADKALEQEKNKIKSELESLSKEGNVDLTIRPIIDSSAMQAAGWDVEDGSIATTFTQGEFIWQGDEENGQYVYVHYTPILPDGTVLTPDELTDYLYGTLEGSQSVLDSDNKGIVLKVDTDLNIPEGDIKKFTNGEGSTDAIDGLIQKTDEWDDKVHSVQGQYYDTGEGINYASNALDGLVEKHKQLENGNETDISFNLENFTDNISEITSAYSTLSSAIEEYNANGAYSLDTMSKLLSLKPEYLALLVDENGQLALNEEGLRSIIQAQLEQAQAEIYATGIAKLKALSDEQAGEASKTAASKMSDSIADIDAQTEAYNENALAAAANAAVKEGGAKQSDVDAIVEETKAQVKAIQNAVNGLTFNTTGVVGGFKSTSDSAKKAAEEAEKATKEYIESYLEFQKQSLETGRIDYQTYSRDVSKFLKDMYDQGKIAAKDYHDYTKEMLTVQKNAMDGVISAVTYRLDKEIDFYEDQIDAVEERYQSEIDYLDTVKEYYEDQKKALQDTNDELDRQKALEDALYNLHQKQTQKTIGLYTADKGKIYTTDASGIRDAEDDVRKAKLDIEIAKLDDAIEKVEQQQDALQEAMDKEKEQLQEIIDRLEDYKEQWQNVAKEYEIAQSEMMAEQMLGADWEKKIISGRIDTLNDFKSSYISIQQAIADAAWASANEQNKAMASVGTGTTDGGGSVNTGDTSIYEVVYEDGAQSVKTFTNKKDAQNYANAMSDGIPDDEPSYYVKLKKYSKGGVISAKKENELTPIAKRIGEDVIISAKEGERVLTPVQNDMWEKWTEAIPNLLDLSNIVKPNIPDYSKISGMVSKSQTIEQHNQFNISLPNITDRTKATQLFEELQRLPLDALQYASKRKR